METDIHEHPLKLFKNIPIQWHCSLAIHQNQCEMKQTTMEYRDYIVYCCLMCQFYLCGLDADSHNKKKPVNPFDDKFISNNPKN